MTDKRDEALKILANMLPPDLNAGMKDTAATTQQFAGQIGLLALGGVFEPLWTDMTIDLRTRSLITIAMLIALRAQDELAIHFPAAIRNGATIGELEQVIYQAIGYAGFPAANSARTIAIDALRQAGMID